MPTLKSDFCANPKNLEPVDKKHVAITNDDQLMMEAKTGI
jgi:hypothetical protein